MILHGAQINEMQLISLGDVFQCHTRHNEMLNETTRIYLNYDFIWYILGTSLRKIQQK